MQASLTHDTDFFPIDRMVKKNINFRTPTSTFLLVAKGEGRLHVCRVVGTHAGETWCNLPIQATIWCSTLRSGTETPLLQMTLSGKDLSILLLSWTECQWTVITWVILRTSPVTLQGKICWYHSSVDPGHRKYDGNGNGRYGNDANGRHGHDHAYGWNGYGHGYGNANGWNGNGRHGNGYGRNGYEHMESQLSRILILNTIYIEFRLPLNHSYIEILLLHLFNSASLCIFIWKYSACPAFWHNISFCLCSPSPIISLILWPSQIGLCTVSAMKLYFYEFYSAG